MPFDRTKEWADLQYYNPRLVLQSAAEKGAKHRLGARTSLPPGVARSERQPLIELFDAAVFARGLQEVRPDLHIEIGQSVTEDHDKDYDLVIRTRTRERAYYAPLQLKVLVGQDVNSQQSLEGLLNDLKKYANAGDLTVAVKIDRLDVDLRTVVVPRLSIGELWCFGEQQDQPEDWFLYGDCLNVPRWISFQPFGRSRQ